MPHFDLTTHKMHVTMMLRRLFSLAALMLAVMTATAQQPAEVLAAARKANRYFMQKYADPTRPTYVRKVRPNSLWTRAVYYEGLMNLYEVDRQPEYLDYALRWARFHRWTPRNGEATTDADDQCCGQTYAALYAYRGMGEDSLLAPVRRNLDHQMATGRHNYWSWIDAIQMAMPLYAMMYHYTGEEQYMDYAMQSYRWSRNECGGGCYNAKSGLWYRDKDFVPPYTEPDGQPCYWSRGNGWVYAALVRVMENLSVKDKRYKELKKDYLAMSRALAACQRPDGLWNVSLLSTNYAGPELSGTALFLYGMSWGLRHGLLKDSAYRPIVARAWQGMISQCLHADGFLGYVQGTGKQPADSQPVTYTSVPDFEDFGTGCFLLGASEYYLYLICNEAH